MAPGYGWPEQAFTPPESLGEGASHPRAEVYSAAALAAFAASGQDPRTPAALDGLPPALRASLARGMQADPAARYGSVKEMAVDVTVEQAIAMDDAADQASVPAGGAVPDWARELLVETAARREAGHPLVGQVTEPEAEETAPAGTARSEAAPAPARTSASAAPPPRPMTEQREVQVSEREKPVRQKPDTTASAFRWDERAPSRSWATTIVIALSVVFILAAVALTIIK